jgi:hypothetical protein
MKIDYLDQDQLTEIIDLLTEAKRIGFSSRSSSIQPLLELMVDLSLKLKEMFKEPKIFWEPRKNQGLRFSQRYSDPLGNPKQIRINFPGEWAYSDELSEYFEELTLKIIFIKTYHRIPQDFHDLERSSAISKKISTKNYHYFRRTRYKKIQ